MTGPELNKLLAAFRSRELRKQSILTKFEKSQSISSELCLKVTCHSKDDFVKILNILTTLHKSPGRTKEQALAIYLFWLCYELSLQLIALFFNVESIQRISDYCSQVELCR